VVFGALVFKLSVWCGAEGYVSGLLAVACVLFSHFFKNNFFLFFMTEGRESAEDVQ
jgi:hypothetical protein